MIQPTAFGFHLRLGTAEAGCPLTPSAQEGWLGFRPLEFLDPEGDFETTEEEARLALQRRARTAHAEVYPILNQKMLSPFLP